jgi:phage terminase large subunit-like protein
LIRELFLLVAKKNSKTTYGALLMLTALLINFRPNGLHLMTAPVKDVADIAFNAVAGAIDLDPVLNKKLHVRDHLKTIIHRETKAELKIMTFDPSVLTGQKVVAALIDELHVCSKMSKADKAIRQLRGGMLPFPEAFLAFITTQSEDAPQGVFKDELTKARDIRDGKRKGRMLPVLYEFPKEMQTGKDQKWKNPKYWPMVTPNLGKSVDIERLIEDYQTARDTSEEELRSWASQHLNVEIGLALMSNHWAGAEFWEACAFPDITVDYLIQHCEVIVVGIDGGGLDDLLGFSVVGRHTETKHWLTWNHAWAHPSVLERRKEIAPALKDFEKEGTLTIVGKVGEDIEQLVDIIDQIEKAFLLYQIGVDTIGIADVLDAIEDAKIPKEKIIGVSQGWKLGGAIKTTERRLAEKSILHDGSALMNWCVGNARVEPRANSILITKQASGTAKIDPLMANLNTNTLMAMNPPSMKAQYQMVIV